MSDCCCHCHYITLIVIVVVIVIVIDVVVIDTYQFIIIPFHSTLQWPCLSETDTFSNTHYLRSDCCLLKITNNSTGDKVLQLSQVGFT